jgi:hypothetical protein
MPTLLLAFAAFLRGFFRSRLSMQLEIVALRHQLAVYQRTTQQPRLRAGDRFLWSWLSRVWSGWRETLVLVQPQTVIAWRRRKFREHWARLPRPGRPGRAAVPREVRALIRQMSTANPLWGSPRIVGELRKIGIDVAKSTVEKYRVKRPRPSPTWTTFLRNHLRDTIAIDILHGPDRPAPGSLCLPRAGPRTETGSPLQRHHERHGSVDGPAAGRSVPLECAPAIPPS